MSSASVRLMQQGSRWSTFRLQSKRQRLCSKPLDVHQCRQGTKASKDYFLITRCTADSQWVVNGQACVKVAGVGGGGGNAVKRMIENGMQGAEFWVVNTDVQVLVGHPAPNRLQIGQELTRGLGSGGKAELGRKAALESEEAMRKVVQGADLIFVAAGMGGGTGTGAAPVLARMAQEAGALTVAVVTVPFAFEGRYRSRQAAEGVKALQGCVDSLIVVHNDLLPQLTGQEASLNEAFVQADDVLRQAVQGISDIITTPGLINVDFADICTVMRKSGTAMLGMGRASGDERAETAAKQACSAPLLGLASIESAKGIVFNIQGGPDMTLAEVGVISDVVTEMAHEDCHIIFGAVVDERYRGQIQVTLIATGFEPLFDGASIRGATAQSPAPLPRLPRLSNFAAAAVAAATPEPATPAAPRVQSKGARTNFFGQSIL